MILPHSLFPVRLLATAVSSVLLAYAGVAAAAGPNGGIAGVSMPGDQIIVTGLDSGQVVGVMAGCDGKYHAENLTPGRYKIVAEGAHRAARTLSVEAGKDAQVDLAPASDVHPRCATGEVRAK